VFEPLACRVRQSGRGERERESVSGIMSGEGGRDLGGWRKSGDSDRGGRGGEVLEVSDEVESSRVCREGKVKH